MARWPKVACVLLLVQAGIGMGPGMARVLGSNTPVSNALSSEVKRSEGERSDDWHFRHELFQMLLEERGLQVVEEQSLAIADPAASVIVMIGSPPQSFTRMDWNDLIHFVQHGGTLLVASDSSFSGTAFGQFVKGPVRTDNSSDQYQGFEDCLRIKLDTLARPWFEGVQEFVTNRCGWFLPNDISWLDWEILATLPPDCQPVASQNGALIAVGRSTENRQGLAMAVADASILSNGMMWHGDNAVAAIRIVDALCDARKSQLLFLSDGQVFGSYRDRLASPRSPSAESKERSLREPELQKVLRLANAVIRELASSNVLNEAMRQQPRHVSPWTYFQALLYAIPILFAAAILWVILQSRVLRANFFGQRLMRPAYELGIFSVGRRADYRKTAGYLAREFCWTVTDSRRSTDWQRFVSDGIEQMPQIDASDRQQLRQVIDAASRGFQNKVDQDELLRFAKSLRKLGDKILPAKHWND